MFCTESSWAIDKKIVKPVAGFRLGFRFIKCLYLGTLLEVKYKLMVLSTLLLLLPILSFCLDSGCSLAATIFTLIDNVFRKASRGGI